MTKRQEPSFTGLVRNELARVDGQTSLERRAELAGIIAVLGRLARDGGKPPGLVLVTTSAALARKVFRYLKTEHKIGAAISVRRGRGARAGNAYQLSLTDYSRLQHQMAGQDAASGLEMLISRVPDYVMASKDARAAYLRGLFLGAGHVHPPQNGYHLEVVVRNEGLARACRELLSGLGITARVARRRSGHAVYVRGGEQVAAALTIMGAHRAVLAFEDARVFRDVRGLVNRLTNAETANLNKAAAAAVRQIQDIRLIVASGELDKLSDSLKAVALARLEHPELSLRELGEQLTPPLSKSAVAHRMRRIQLLARKIGSTGAATATDRR